MNLGHYKLFLAVIGLIGVLIAAVPSFSDVIVFPVGEQFSELYLLDSDHVASHYPSSIMADQNYKIYVGVVNHLRSSANYVLYVKLATDSDPLPNVISSAPSFLKPLYEYRFAIKDNMSWENAFDFKFSNLSITGDNSLLATLEINGAELKIDKPSTLNSNSTSIKFLLLFELWLYNAQTGSMDFNNRYTNLELTFEKIVD